MNSPLPAAIRFGWALLLGAALGLYYGFLRPLRRKHVHLADLLFFPGLFVAWMYLSFGVCRGDLRLAYTMGLFAGAILWECTLGKLLRPFFSWVWRFAKALVGLILWPFEKIFLKIAQFAKFLFAIRKKRSTIK
jgi:hypothetical protein